MSRGHQSVGLWWRAVGPSRSSQRLELRRVWSRGGGHSKCASDGWHQTWLWSRWIWSSGWLSSSTEGFECNSSHWGGYILPSRKVSSSHGYEWKIPWMNFHV